MFFIIILKMLIRKDKYERGLYNNGIALLWED